MASGLFALLDDVAAIAKIAAASIDDMTAAAGKATAKAAGVVVDDTAVTPRYVAGLSPARELPIIGKIALGSLRNKLLILLPAAMLLSAFAPWAITPILMLGGAYLCFEGAEKLAEALGFGHHHATSAAEESTSSVELEKLRVSGAIRTDLILSAEIMAIALGDVANSPLMTQAVVLAIVSLVVTAGVYGVVALLVKMDDMGIGLWKRSSSPPVRAAARGLVRGMPRVMSFLSTVGIAAMLWMGGQIILHGLEHFGLHLLPDAIHSGAAAIASLAPDFLHEIVEWIVSAAGAAIVGIGMGAIIVGAVRLFERKAP